MKGNKNTHFVKGQKLIRVDYDGLAPEKLGRIYTFIGYNNESYVVIETSEGNTEQYYSERFETIIQSLDDVVKGMELTVKKDLSFINREGFYITGKQKNPKIIVSYLSKYHDNSVVCVEKDFWWPIECFEEYQPKKQVVHHINGIQDNSITNLRYVDPSDNKRRNKKMEKEIKVVKNFTILDIYKARPKYCGVFDSEYETLLIENNLMDSCSVGFYVYADDSDIKASKVLMRNIPWLIQKGFVKEVEKDVVLKPGMRVKDNNNRIYLIDQDYRFIQTNNGYVCENTDMKTLSELEAAYLYNTWSVVDE